MKGVKQVSLVGLVIAAFALAISSQTLRPAGDPRNIAPTAGTGGNPGGPTGLFTIYDGQTLRKGEFTFSVAYSNYDRDPGNVDITEAPVSFQIGLNDHLELFFTTDAYRGVKVNNPKNLSSFYLPNSQLFFGSTLLGSGAAIILAPERVSGPTVGNGMVFRPAFNQPFVQFPFIGGPGPNLGLTGNNIAPPFVSRLGTPSGESSNFGAAGNFPGIGSPCGSILPGVVLTTRTIPPNSTFNTLTVPNLFTVCPSYLPDAPFINRLYGESSFSTMNAGAKIRFTGPHNPIGVGIVPFYRWYMDKADDASGFNQLQRGASPGGNLGDFGLMGFVDARISRHVNMSVNIGYILNSNPKSEAMGNVALLDRPDEFITGFGLDFPVTKHVQPILEFKHVHYMGGSTPNAFPNNPSEALGGVRVFPKSWFGFSGWYRVHLNQQGDRLWGGRNYPDGFDQSVDPHGYGFQVFAGRRNLREQPKFNGPPNIDSVTLSDTVITLPCPANTKSRSGSCGDNHTISVATKATDPDNDVMTYSYTVSGGRIVGSGPNVSWDLSGAQVGTYTITTGADDGCGMCGKTDTRTITVRECPDCEAILHCSCGTLSVTGPSGVVAPGVPMTFTANVSGGGDVTYNWSVSAGTITSGQGTSSITVDTTGLGGQNVTATVELGGTDPACGCETSKSETGSVQGLPTPTQIDEFGKVTNDDIKARVDGFFTQLNNNPTAQGYIINYGTPAEIKARRAAIMKAITFRKYDASRVTFVDGPDQGTGIMTRFWLVPSGAVAPTP
jgi:hypothetical protein